MVVLEILNHRFCHQQVFLFYSLLSFLLKVVFKHVSLTVTCSSKWSFSSCLSNVNEDMNNVFCMGRLYVILEIYILCTRYVILEKACIIIKFGCTNDSCLLSILCIFLCVYFNKSRSIHRSAEATRYVSAVLLFGGWHMSNCYVSVRFWPYMSVCTSSALWWQTIYNNSDVFLSN
jgi:hypothetical protein